ncbi:MAG: hypothetical protein ABEH35_01780 [Haloarculaceae archaeon]
MATQQRTATEAYRCPHCAGPIAFSEGAWGCTDCDYVPRHAAD